MNAFSSELRKSLRYPSKPLLKEQKNLHIVTVLKPCAKKPSSEK